MRRNIGRVNEAAKVGASAMARIAIIVGHARRGTFCQALGEAYRRGALAAGHEASLFVTAEMAFDPVLRKGFERVQPLEPDLQPAHDALLAADHLVIIFPLWFGALPAILKGFIERVLQPDLIEPARQRRFVNILRGKSARIIVTMGMPGFVYRWWFGVHALKMLERNILGFIGVRPIRSSIFGNIEGVGADGRRRWLEQATAMGHRAV
jgi:NAD(P)H dehydrogenase (quinone)